MIDPKLADKLVVIFVTTSFGRGENGPETYARYLWEGFGVDAEIEFHMVAPSFPGPHPRWHAAGTAGNSWAFYRALSRKALDVARACGPERVILHCNHCHLDPLVLEGGFPVFGQINDYENAELPGRWRDVVTRQGFRRGISLWLRRRREKRFVENQDLTICNSEYTRRAVLNAYRPLREHRVVTIHKAVDFDAYRPPAPLPGDPLARDASRVQLLFIGTDFVRKGLDLLLAAMPDFAGQAELTVVGATEAQVDQVFPSLAQANRVAGTVRYAGRIEKDILRRILWRSTALVLPSRAEALGVALLEAAAAGLHVIATRVGGIPEIIERLPGAVMVAPESSAEIAQAIRAVAGNRVRPVFENSAIELFSKERMLARIRALYLSFPNR